MPSNLRLRMKKRSPLTRWLHEHRNEIAEVFASQSRSGWEALAATARDNGVVDANGRPPNPGAVRTAWKKIERDMNKTAVNRTPKPLPEFAPVAPLPAPVRQGPSTDSPTPSPRQRHSFRVATFKKD